MLCHLVNIMEHIYLIIAYVSESLTQRPKICRLKSIIAENALIH